MVETDTKITLVLPGAKLDRRLTPNSRSHWRVKHKLSAANKLTAYYKVQEYFAADDELPTPYGWMQQATLPITVTFTRYYSGRAKAFDNDNLPPAFKAYRDGLAYAFEMDDGPKYMTGQYIQTRCAAGEDRLEITIEL